MQNKHITLIITGVLLIIGALTNPTQDRHKEAVKNKLNVIMQKSIKDSMKNSDSGAEQIGSALGLMLGEAILDRMIESTISSDNYVLFSTTKATWEGKTKIIGVGVFGNVFISDEIDKALKEGKGEIQRN
jgi:hypothetical protein